MSRFSGKCDLYDHIMMSKYYDNGGIILSDELECFNIFKERTGGVIYQNVSIKVTERNLDYVKAHTPYFDYSTVTQTKADKRSKTGTVTNQTTIYTYMGKEYCSLRELNMQDVRVKKEIKFDTLLDIIPYYPYTIASGSFSKDNYYCVVADISEVERNNKSLLECGIESSLDYRRVLQDHYLEVCKNYFLFHLDERITITDIDIDAIIPVKLDKEPFVEYHLPVQDDIDYMHPAKWYWLDGSSKPHYTNPKIIDKNTICISKEDFEDFLCEDIQADIIKIKYVKDCEFPLYKTK